MISITSATFACPHLAPLREPKKRIKYCFTKGKQPAASAEDAKEKATIYLIQIFYNLRT